MNKEQYEAQKAAIEPIGHGTHSALTDEQKKAWEKMIEDDEQANRERAIGKPVMQTHDGIDIPEIRSAMTEQVAEKITEQAGYDVHSKADWQEAEYQQFGERTTHGHKEHKRKKVAIVGTAMTFKDAPYNDPTWEIWGLNDHWNNMPRYTAWFECNNTACRTANVSHQPNMKRVDWLKTSPVPVYMQEHYDDIPNSVRYPWEEINDMVGATGECGRDYFTNSVSYMIALAIYQGYDEIGLYGVDMAVGSEYEKQRPSCEFWVGFGKGRGIKFFIPDQSDLLKTMVIYGRDNGKADAFRLKMNDRKVFQQGQVKQIDQEVAKHQDQIQRLSATKFQYQGSLADIDQTLKVWGGL